MYSLEIVEASEVVGALPGPVPLRGSLRDFYHLGIFPLGFEDRVLRCAAELAQEDVRLSHALVLTYETNLEDNESNWSQLSASLGSVASDLSRRQFIPAEVGEIVRSFVEDVESGTKVGIFVDISGASNSLLLDLIWILLELDVELTLGYAAAETYLPSRDEVLTPTGRLRRRREGSELAEGTGDLRIDVNHNGRFSESGEDLVVMIPGFDDDRCRKVINSVDASLLHHDTQRVQWILGDPLRPEDSWRFEYQQKVHKDSGCGSNPDGLHRCSTYDYRSIVEVLEAIYGSARNRSRITLSPMGSKMQAIGCALFCVARPEVRVKFASPLSYNARHYSEGSRPPVVLDFGSTALVRAAVRSIGALRVRGPEGLVFKGVDRLWGGGEV
jgi:hypothetical protein